MYHCLVQTFLVISVKVECELFHDHCDRSFPECETAWLVLSCSVCPAACCGVFSVRSCSLRCGAFSCCCHRPLESCFCIFVCLKILSHQISEIRLRTPMSASASSCLMICHLRILFLVRFLLFLFYCIAGFAFIGVYNVKVTLGIFGFALWL